MSSQQRGGMLPYMGSSGMFSSNGYGSYGLPSLMSRYESNNLSLMDSETLRKIQQQQRSSSGDSPSLESKERHHALSERLKREMKEMDMFEEENAMIREANAKRRLKLMNERSELKQEQQALMTIELRLRQQQEALERKHHLLEELERRHHLIRQDQVDRERQMYNSGLLGPSGLAGYSASAGSRMGMHSAMGARAMSGSSAGGGLGSFDPRLRAAHMEQLRKQQQMSLEDKKRRLEFGHPSSDDKLELLKKRLKITQGAKAEPDEETLRMAQMLQEEDARQTFFKMRSGGLDGLSKDDDAFLARGLPAAEKALLGLRSTSSPSSIDEKLRMLRATREGQGEPIEVKAESLESADEGSKSEEEKKEVVVMGEKTAEEPSKGEESLETKLNETQKEEKEDVTVIGEVKQSLESTEELSEEKSNVLRGDKVPPRHSRYSGVSWDQENKRWQARVFLSGELKVLGSFPSEELAALIVDVRKVSYQGADADKLNFTRLEREVLERKYKTELQNAIKNF